MMKTLAALLAICLMLLLVTMGCAKEEPPPPPPKKPLKIKIVKSAKRQEPEKLKAPIPGKQEKGEIPKREVEEGKVVVVGKIPKRQVEEAKPIVAEQIPKMEAGEAKPIVVGEKPVQRSEKASEEEWTAAKEAKEVKTALGKELPKKPAGEAKPIVVGEKPVQRSEKAAEEEMEGYYIVKKGESLYDVASREEVYGNRLKWPILYRSNIDTLGDLKTKRDISERALPEGLKLRVIDPDDVEENLEKRPNKRWAVNVLSTTTYEEIFPITTTLIKDGYTAYLTRATVKGKVWTRLRIGFFTSRAEADAQRERIEDLLDIDDSWIVKLPQEEFEEFAGY
jgi:hypothetical protein